MAYIDPSEIKKLRTGDYFACKSRRRPHGWGIIYKILEISQDGHLFTLKVIECWHRPELNGSTKAFSRYYIDPTNLYWIPHDYILKSEFDNE